MIEIDELRKLPISELAAIDAALSTLERSRSNRTASEPYNKYYRTMGELHKRVVAAMWSNLEKLAGI